MQFISASFALFILAAWPIWSVAAEKAPKTLPFISWMLCILAIAIGAGAFSAYWAGGFSVFLIWRLSRLRSSGAVEHVLSIGALIAPLGYFKYSQWIASIIDSAWAYQAAWGARAPFGISFYTFSSIAAIYFWRSQPEHGSVAYGWVDSVSKVFMVSTAASGPVAGPEAFKQRFGPSSDWGSICTPFLAGLFLKLVLSTRFAEYASPETPLLADGFAKSFWGIHAYGAQLYCDFCGYSLMAVGLGRLFGLELPDNFNSPYASRSIGEFWRRWHISLSGFWRERIYIPLGGNRGGRTAELRNLMAVMLLCGIWHGASFSFLAWGALHGAALCIQRMWNWWGRWKIPSFLGWALTFEFAMLAWIPFQQEPQQAMASLKGISTFDASLPPLGLAILLSAMAVEHKMLSSWMRKGIQASKDHPALYFAGCALILMASIAMAPPGIPPFIYAGF